MSKQQGLPVRIPCGQASHGPSLFFVVCLTLVCGCDKATTDSSSSPTQNPIDAETPPSLPDDKVQNSFAANFDTVLRQSDWFEDKSEASQLNFGYSTGRDAGRNTILETVGGGLGICDFDNDGWCDFFCVGGGQIDQTTGVPTGKAPGVFRNVYGNRFSNVTNVSGLNQVTDYSHGCVCGDLNNDGFLDAFVTCYGSNRFYLNQGDGTFVDHTNVAGLATNGWNTAAAFGDVNRDGDLDIFVTGYVDWIPSADVPSDIPAPQNYKPVADHLLLNSGDGHFTDISKEAGIRADGMGLGVIATDVNEDQEIDFYVANDVVENHLYIGSEGVQLDEVGEQTGVAFNESGTPEGSMGIDSEDVNGDGHDDLWVTNFEMEDNSLYLNLGMGQFQHATTAFRLAGVGRRQVKFGTGLQDFDGDNWPDLFVVNGHVRYYKGMEPFLQGSVLCRNESGKAFAEVTDAGGCWFRNFHAARGTATGDLDNDGGLDLAISSLTESVALLYNRHPARNWIQIQPIGVQSPRFPVGCRITVGAFDRQLTRTFTSGAGYLSHSDSRMLIALEADRSTVDVGITWPSGTQEEFDSVSTLKQTILLIEGRGKRVSSSTDTSGLKK